MEKALKIVIVGGVAGGASAAARLRRLSEQAEIIMIERGPYISFANCGLPYHIGGIIEDRDKLLVQTSEAMHQRFNIDIRTQQEVIGINIENKMIRVKLIDTQEEYDQSYDKLILSPGAKPVKPPIPGINNKRVVTLRNITDMDYIINFLKNKPHAQVAVIGAGYIGLEMVEALLEKGHQPVLIEMSNQILNVADAEMVSPIQEHLIKLGVTLKLKQGVVAFTEEDNQLIVVTSQEEKIPCDLALLAIGVKPETALAQAAGLRLGPTKGIEVNGHMQTSHPDIYAVGDVIEVSHFVSDQPVLIPLAGPANRQGRIAADHIMGRSGTYKKTQGTAVCKVMDFTIAMTGLNEKQLKQAGQDYRKIYLHPFSHASYYPGAKHIHLKLLFEKESGRLLGAQAVGRDGVEKRIDVLATAMRGMLTVFDLEDLELSYAPPYGSAKDPVNFLGFVASNWLRGDVDMVHCEQLEERRADQVVLDVRTEGELKWGGIPGAINIPVDELRSRLQELDKENEYWVTCRVGIRAYIAARILTQLGFNAKLLSGSYLTYQAFQQVVK